MPTLRARGWGWRHAGRRDWALRGVDLDVDAGERVLLLGPSGAGKSTLLAGLAGLLDGSDDGTGQEEGSLLVDGVPAARARREAVASTRGRAATGLLLQDPQAQTVLARCGDDVAFGLENHGVDPAAIWPRVRTALAEAGLDVDLDRPTSALSGGQRQRLALAGVLALRPGVLLLDEPTAMLDPPGASALRDAVATQLDATGGGCVVVEHRVAAWLDVVDRVVVLTPGGGVVADGPAEQVLARHGADLAARGVWVPGHGPRVPPRGAAAPAGGEALLAARDVDVGRRGLAAPVLTGVDLDVTAGRAGALLGVNGSGKSTLALALAGLAAPLAGEVAAGPALAAGKATRPHRWRPRDLVTRIGSVFQDPRHQFVTATVADELAVGPRRTGTGAAATASRVEELLVRLRLRHLAGANPFTLSGGEQRRLSVATALATRPRVLVLDEPTFGQDALTWAELAGLLTGLLDDGAALVTATHDEAFVAAVCDDVWHLDAGAVRAAEPAS